jgi:hypothetical protein
MRPSLTLPRQIAGEPATEAAERGGLKPTLDGTPRRLSRLTARQVTDKPYGDKCPQRRSPIQPNAELGPSRFRRERRYGLRG